MLGEARTLEPTDDSTQYLFYLFFVQNLSFLCARLIILQNRDNIDILVFSHSWNVSRNHDITNYRHQKEGHKTKATHSNTMNGSDTNKNLLPRQQQLEGKSTIAHDKTINSFNTFTHSLYSTSIITHCSNSKHNRSCSLDTNHTPIIGIVDSGASGHYGPLNLTLLNKRACTEKINVSLPNNTIISLTHSAYLNMPNLPKVATNLYLFPDIHDILLLSVAQFCDNRYTVEFN